MTMNGQDNENGTENRIRTVDDQQDRRENSDALKELSYMILFFGAVFTVSAMETGSYRTPWPVALITLLAGIILYGYSRSPQSKK